MQRKQWQGDRHCCKESGCETLTARCDHCGDSAAVLLYPAALHRCGPGLAQNAHIAQLSASRAQEPVLVAHSPNDQDIHGNLVGYSYTNRISDSYGHTDSHGNLVGYSCTNRVGDSYGHTDSHAISIGDTADSPRWGCPSDDSPHWRQRPEPRLLARWHAPGLHPL
jgi:hypothetical protein